MPLLSGTPRSLHAFNVDASTYAFVAGTHTKAYYYVGGTLYDVTPASFTTGGIHTTYTDTGEDPLQGTYTEAAVWIFDSFVDDSDVVTVVGVHTADGKIYGKTFGTASSLFIQLTGSPTSAKALVVTPERYLVVIAPGGDHRIIQFADQESLTVWPAANFLTLDGPGQLMCGAALSNETLIWSDSELFGLHFLGDPVLIYGTSKKSSACGIISRQAFAKIGADAVTWMGQGQFYMYDGFVRPVPCPVADYVFGRLSLRQRHKVVCSTIHQFNEVWWFYPSEPDDPEDDAEIDSYVVWNWRENHWTIGNLARTAIVDSGPLRYPLMADSAGDIYEHEKDDDRGSEVPFAESAPVDIMDGTVVLAATALVPDEKTLGDVNVTLKSRLHPTATEIVHGPFSSLNPTPVRVTARQVVVRIDQNIETDWRVGTFRLEVTPSGRR
jgi:predicted heme/steroid binding protein